MSEDQTQRTSVTACLTATAERTIVENEEELCDSKQENQRKQELLDSALKALSPRVVLNRHGVQLPSLSPGPDLKQEIPETLLIEEEPEEQSIKQEEEQLQISVLESSAICVKTEESSLLQQTQNEPKEEQTQREGISSEPHFHSETEGETQMEIEADGEHYIQIQIRDTSTAVQNSGLSPKSAPKTIVNPGDMSGTAKGAKKKKRQCSVAEHIRTHTAEGEENLDLVADILARPFSRRTFQEKLDLVRRGRPTPELANLSQAGKGFVRHFQSSNYERYPWLTASEGRCKLFCWECLLFAKDGAWSCTGFANLSCLTKAATRHQSTSGHLQATVLLKIFGDTRVDSQLNELERRERELHNEKVMKNREILKILIDCVMFLGKQELSFRGHNESTQATNAGNYMELLSFLAEHDKDLHYHLSTNRVFTGTSGKIQNDLINAVAEVMGEEIKTEIKKAPFVAVMVDETTDVANPAQLALVLRYVTTSGVKERFVKYVDVTSGRRADDIAALIFSFLEEYECCLDKVVAQCYDGAAVMASGLNGVQAKVKERAPMALFIHSYAHRLNLVLTQGASKLKECKVFFATLNGLAAFFSRSPKRTQLLDEMCKRRLPHVAPTRWQFASKLVNTVHQKRVVMKELFDHMLEHHDEYDEDAVLCADRFNERLDDFEFCFLLNTFNSLFEHADALFVMLQKKTFDVQFCMARVNEFCDTVERARGGFDQIYDETLSISGGPSVRRGQGAALSDLRAHYQQLHSNILDNILCQIQNRFQDHDKLLFLSLLDPQHFQTHRKTFPQKAFSSLTQSHGALFDLPRLKTELTVTYTMTDFERKGPADLLDFLRSKGLTESMGQLYTLACLALTIPVSTASAERSFSALKRIKTYARNTTGHMRLSALASMSIEKDWLLELKRTDKLYNQVIEVFLKKEKRLDFVLK